MLLCEKATLLYIGALPLGLDFEGSAVNILDRGSEYFLTSVL